jgi:hypothetical protein
MRLIGKGKHVYFLLYTLILYYFCVTLSSKEHLFRRNSSSEDNQLRSFFSMGEEKKFLVDFRYKKQMHASLMGAVKENLVFVDSEHRILGSKSLDYQDNLSTKFTVYLNKKFLHSFLLGSIKLIHL